MSVPDFFKFKAVVPAVTVMKLPEKAPLNQTSIVDEYLEGVVRTRFSEFASTVPSASKELPRFERVVKESVW